MLFSNIGHYPLDTNFDHDWSFLRPRIQIIEDSFLRKVEVKFETLAKTQADRALLKFLEDIFQTFVE